MSSIADQNFVVWNQGKNPLVNFNFMLRVELLFDLPCKSVRAFTRELEYDYIQEGGLNDYVHMRRKGITKPFTMEVERYVGVDYVDPLPLGAELALPMLLFVSRAHDQFIPGVVARTYVFTGASVIKKTYGDLIADQSGLLVETTTFAYREMLCVDIPWSEAGDSIFGKPPAASAAAKTVDKTLEQLKQEGQAYYERALAANALSKTEFTPADADIVIPALKATLQSMRDALKSSGPLGRELSAAQAGLTAGGKPLTKLAEEGELAQKAEKTKLDTALTAQLEQAQRASADFPQQQAQAQAAIKQAEAQRVAAETDQKEATARQTQAKSSIVSAETAAQTAQTVMDSAQRGYAQAEKSMADASARQKEALDAQAAAKTALQAAQKALGEADEGSRATAATALEKANAQVKAADEAVKKAQESQASDQKLLEDKRKAREQAQVALREKKLALEKVKGDMTATTAALAAAPGLIAGAVQDKETAQLLLDGLKQQEASTKALVKKLTAERTTVQASLTSLTKEVESATSAQTAAQTEAGKAQADYATAKAAHDTALAAANAARDKATTAASRLTQAQSNSDRGQKLATSLQNASNQLPNRKIAANVSQAACATAHPQCQTANTSLQAAGTVAEAKPLCDEVQQHAKAVLYEQRQVHDTAQYIQTAKALDEQATAFLAGISAQAAAKDLPTGG